MNPLTLIRDLVYQRRFTESLKLSLTCKDIGLPYIKTHSGELNPSRKSIWLGNGDGRGSGWGFGDGGGWGFGDGYGSGWGYSDSPVGGYSWRRGHGEGYGYLNPTRKSCPWRVRK